MTHRRKRNAATRCRSRSAAPRPGKRGGAGRRGEDCTEVCCHRSRHCIAIANRMGCCVRTSCRSRNPSDWRPPPVRCRRREVLKSRRSENVGTRPRREPWKSARYSQPTPRRHAAISREGGGSRAPGRRRTVSMSSLLRPRTRAGPRQAAMSAERGSADADSRIARMPTLCDTMILPHPSGEQRERDTKAPTSHTGYSKTFPSAHAVRYRTTSPKAESEIRSRDRRGTATANRSGARVHSIREDPPQRASPHRVEAIDAIAIVSAQPHIEKCSGTRLSTRASLPALPLASRAGATGSRPDASAARRA